MANRANTTTYDLAAIMRAAWKKVRLIRESYGAWQIERGFVDASFATALRRAWAEAKDVARKAAAMAGIHGDRILALKEHIERLSYKGLRYDIAAEAAALRAEIAELEAA